MAETKPGGPGKPMSKGGSRAGRVSGPKQPAAKGPGKSGAGTGTAANLPDVQTGPESPAPAGPLAIVGVGASAGGLEAFTNLVGNLPPDTGMGFVLVQHMAPRAHSMLPEILARATQMPVTEVREGMRVQPNQIYVTPPGITMTLEEGVLHLATREEPRGLTRPIDVFLRSLGQDQGRRAIGVILSGTSSDGVQGLQAIKAEGGVTFAQDVESAKYPGMPESAIAAGVVDFVLPPEKIAWQLARLAHHPLVNKPAPAKEEMPPEEEGVFNQILMLLKSAAGLDFTQYKQSTIKRRIQRRMMLRQVEKIEDYVQYLRQHPDEVKDLFEDILINVTSFFREPEAFESLEKIVFPEILRNRADDEPIRIWVPGCASGEEAYSLAICLLEFLGDMASNVQIQIFATDIEDGVIDKARLGIYPESITANVSPDRLRRFFSKVSGGYQVSKTIRSMCVFAKQNLTKDPPFSRLDLISCRNVLIYFGPGLQKRVISVFHFSLKPGGFLLLGKSEALSAFSEFFTLVDKKIKVFQKKPVAVPHPLLPPFTGEAGRFGGQGKVEVKSPGNIVSAGDLQQEADRIVLSRFAPAGVVIDGNLNIIQFRGQTGRYLEPSPGKASLNLIKWTREGLQIEIKAALHAALKSNTPVRKERLRLHLNGALRVVNLEVLPLRPATALERYFLVIFEEATPPVEPPVPKGEAPRGKPSAKDRTIADQKSELAATKEYLQTVIEEQETSVEELKRTNEELMSANEELQSINEEMETSKEELQSANEELATLNEELGNRNQELFQANNDLNNLLTTVPVAIVILGPDLRIRRFNPAAQEMLSLIPADLGRTLGDIRLKVEAPELEQVIKDVLHTLIVKELEVPDREGRWFSLRLQPYRTSDNRIDGVVLAVVDVDLLKRSLDEARQARDYTQAIIATMREPLVVLDGKLKVVSANDAYYRIFKADPQDTEGHYFYELGQGQWNLHSLRQFLGEVLPANQQFRDFEMLQEFPEIGRRTMLLNGRLLPLGGPAHDLILLAIEDVTARRDAEQVLESEARLRKLARKLLAHQEAERQELSNELQESLAQGLAAVKLELRTFEEKLPGGEGTLRQDYRQALGQIDEIVEKLRRRAADLSPQMLADLGLAGGLKALAEGCGMECDLQLDDLGRSFDLEDQVNIYRVIQEALSNARQHAQAARVTLSGKKADGQAEFLVEDNGQGFEVGRLEDVESGRRGIGLASMAERVKAMGGTFKLESRVGAGTRVFFTIPITRKK